MKLMNGFMTFIVVAVLILAAVLVWLVVKNNGKNKCCGNGGRRNACGTSNALLSADAFDTGAISLTATATGAGTDVATTGFVTILSTDICSQSCHNRLYAAVSLQSAITATSSIATGAAGTVASTIGVAAIEIQVLVDGLVAMPGIVTVDGLTRIISEGLDPLAASLDLLSLTEANSFNFVFQGLRHGPHTIEVQARLTVLATNVLPIGETVTAAISNRSLVVQQGNAYVFVPPSPPSISPVRRCF